MGMTANRVPERAAPAHHPGRKIVRVILRAVAVPEHEVGPVKRVDVRERPVVHPEQPGPRVCKFRAAHDPIIVRQGRPPTGAAGFFSYQPRGEAPVGLTSAATEDCRVGTSISTNASRQRKSNTAHLKDGASGTAMRKRLDGR